MEITTISQLGDGPEIFWLASRRHWEYREAVYKRIKELSGEKSFSLSVVPVDRWGDQLTPWQASSPYGKEIYGGEGDKTLNELVEQIKNIEGKLPSEKRYIVGYSLAGLFSLWAFYKSGFFHGVASCSGSLWYPGWDKFSSNINAPQNSIVYLSLGDKEENTKNFVMKKVGEATRTQFETIRKDKNIIDSVFELNPGGHFRDTEERIAKGMAWLICR